MGVSKLSSKVITLNWTMHIACMQPFHTIRNIVFLLHRNQSTANSIQLFICLNNDVDMNSVFFLRNRILIATLDLVE